MNYGGGLPDWQQYNVPQRSESLVGTQNVNGNHLYVSSLGELRPEFEGLAKPRGEAYGSRNPHSPGTLAGANGLVHFPIPSAVQMPGCVKLYETEISGKNGASEGTIGGPSRNGSVESNEVPRVGNQALSGPVSRTHLPNINVNHLVGNPPPGPPRNPTIGPGRQVPYGPCKGPCCVPDPNAGYRHWEKFGVFQPNGPYRENMHGSGYGQVVENRRYPGGEFNFGKEGFEGKDVLGPVPLAVDPRRSFPGYKYQKEPIPSNYPSSSRVLPNYPIQGYNFAEYQKYPYAMKNYPSGGGMDSQNPGLLNYQDQSIVVQQKYSGQMQYQNSQRGIVPPGASGSVAGPGENPYFTQQHVREVPRKFVRDCREGDFNLGYGAMEAAAPLQEVYANYQMYQRKIAVQKFTLENHLKEMSRIPGYQTHPKYQEYLMRYRELITLQQTVDRQNGNLQEAQQPMASPIGGEVQSINLQFNQNGVLINSSCVADGFASAQRADPVMGNVGHQEQDRLLTGRETALESRNVQAEERNIDHPHKVDLSSSSSSSFQESSSQDEDRFPVRRDFGQEEVSDGTSGRMGLDPLDKEDEDDSVQRKTSKNFANKPDLDVRQFLANWGESEDEEILETVPSEPVTITVANFSKSTVDVVDFGPNVDLSNAEVLKSFDKDSYGEIGLAEHKDEKIIVEVGEDGSPKADSHPGPLELLVNENETPKSVEESGSLHRAEDAPEETSTSNDGGGNSEAGSGFQDTFIGIGSTESKKDSFTSLQVVNESYEGTLKSLDAVPYLQLQGQEKISCSTLESSSIACREVETLKTSDENLNSVAETKQQVYSGSGLSCSFEETLERMRDAKHHEGRPGETPTTLKSRTGSSEAKFLKQGSFASEESHNNDDLSLPDLATSECTPLSTTLNTPVHSDSEESPQREVDLTIPSNPIEIIGSDQVIGFPHSPMKLDAPESETGRKRYNGSEDFYFKNAEYDGGLENRKVGEDNIEVANDPEESLRLCESTHGSKETLGPVSLLGAGEDILLVEENFNGAMDSQDWASSSKKYNLGVQESEEPREMGPSKIGTIGGPGGAEGSSGSIDEVLDDHPEKDLGSFLDKSGVAEECSSEINLPLTPGGDLRGDREGDKVDGLLEPEMKKKFVMDGEGSGSEVDPSFCSLEDKKSLCQEKEYSRTVLGQLGFPGDPNMIPLIPGEETEEPKMPVQPMEGNCLTAVIKDTMPITDLSILESDEEKLDKVEDIWGEVRCIEKDGISGVYDDEYDQQDMDLEEGSTDDHQSFDTFKPSTDENQSTMARNQGEEKKDHAEDLAKESVERFHLKNPSDDLPTLVDYDDGRRNRKDGSSRENEFDPGKICDGTSSEFLGQIKCESKDPEGKNARLEPGSVLRVDKLSPGQTERGDSRKERIKLLKEFRKIKKRPNSHQSATDKTSLPSADVTSGPVPKNTSKSAGVGENYAVERVQKDPAETLAVSDLANCQSNSQELRNESIAMIKDEAPEEVPEESKLCDDYASGSRGAFENNFQIQVDSLDLRNMEEFMEKGVLEAGNADQGAGEAKDSMNMLLTVECDYDSENLHRQQALEVDHAIEGLVASAIDNVHSEVDEYLKKYQEPEKETAPGFGLSGTAKHHEEGSLQDPDVITGSSIELHNQEPIHPDLTEQCVEIISIGRSHSDADENAEESSVMSYRGPATETGEVSENKDSNADKSTAYPVAGELTSPCVRKYVAEEVVEEARNLNVSPEAAESLDEVALSNLEDKIHSELTSDPCSNDKTNLLTADKTKPLTIDNPDQGLTIGRSISPDLHIEPPNESPSRRNEDDNSALSNANDIRHRFADNAHNRDEDVTRETTAREFSGDQKRTANASPIPEEDLEDLPQKMHSKLDEDLCVDEDPESTSNVEVEGRGNFQSLKKEEGRNIHPEKRSVLSEESHSKARNEFCDSTRRVEEPRGNSSGSDVDACPDLEEGTKESSPTVPKTSSAVEGRDKDDNGAWSSPKPDGYPEAEHADLEEDFPLAEESRFLGNAPKVAGNFSTENTEEAIDFDKDPFTRDSVDLEIGASYLLIGKADKSPLVPEERGSGRAKMNEVPENVSGSFEDSFGLNDRLGTSRGAEEDAEEIDPATSREIETLMKSSTSPDFDGDVEASSFNFDKFDIESREADDVEEDDNSYQQNTLSSDRWSSKISSRYEECEKYKNPDGYVSPTLANLNNVDLNSVPVFTTKDGKITYSPNPRFTYRALIMEAQERGKNSNSRQVCYPDTYSRDFFGYSSLRESRFRRKSSPFEEDPEEDLEEGRYGRHRRDFWNRRQACDSHSERRDISRMKRKRESIEERRCKVSKRDEISDDEDTDEEADRGDALPGISSKSSITGFLDDLLLDRLQPTVPCKSHLGGGSIRPGGVRPALQGFSLDVETGRRGGSSRGLPEDPGESSGSRMRGSSTVPLISMEMENPKMKEFKRVEEFEVSPKFSDLDDKRREAFGPSSRKRISTDDLIESPDVGVDKGIIFEPGKHVVGQICKKVIRGDDEEFHSTCESPLRIARHEEKVEVGSKVIESDLEDDKKNVSISAEVSIASIRDQGKPIDPEDRQAVVDQIEEVEVKIDNEAFSMCESIAVGSKQEMDVNASIEDESSILDVEKTVEINTEFICTVNSEETTSKDEADQRVRLKKSPETETESKKNIDTEDITVATAESGSLEEDLKEGKNNLIENSLDDLKRDTKNLAKRKKIPDASKRANKIVEELEKESRILEIPYPEEAPSSEALIHSSQEKIVKRNPEVSSTKMSKKREREHRGKIISDKRNSNDLSESKRSKEPGSSGSSERDSVAKCKVSSPVKHHEDVMENRSINIVDVSENLNKDPESMESEMESPMKESTVRRRRNNEETFSSRKEDRNFDAKETKKTEKESGTSLPPKIPKMIIKNIKSRPGTPILERIPETSKRTSKSSTQTQKSIRVSIKLKDGMVDTGSGTLSKDILANGGKLPKIKIKLEDALPKVVIQNLKIDGTSEEGGRRKLAPKLKIKKIKNPASAEADHPLTSTSKDLTCEQVSRKRRSEGKREDEKTSFEEAMDDAEEGIKNEKHLERDQDRREKVPVLKIRKQDSSDSDGPLESKKRSRSSGFEVLSKKPKKTLKENPKQGSVSTESDIPEVRDAGEDRILQISGKIPKVIIKRASSTAEFKCELSKGRRRKILKSANWQPEVRLERSWELDLMAKDLQSPRSSSLEDLEKDHGRNRCDSRISSESGPRGGLLRSRSASDLTNLKSVERRMSDSGVERQNSSVVSSSSAITDDANSIDSTVITAIGRVRDELEVIPRDSKEKSSKEKFRSLGNGLDENMNPKDVEAEEEKRSKREGDDSKVGRSSDKRRKTKRRRSAEVSNIIGSGSAVNSSLKSEPAEEELSLKKVDPSVGSTISEEECRTAPLSEEPEVPQKRILKSERGFPEGDLGTKDTPDSATSLYSNEDKDHEKLDVQLNDAEEEPLAKDRTRNLAPGTNVAFFEFEDNDGTSVIKIDSSDESQTTIEILPASPDFGREPEEKPSRKTEGEVLYSSDSIPTQFGFELEIGEESISDPLDIPIPFTAEPRIRAGEYVDSVDSVDSLDSEEDRKPGDLREEAPGGTLTSSSGVQERSPYPNCEGNYFSEDTRSSRSFESFDTLSGLGGKKFCCSDSLVEEVLAAKETLKKCLSKVRAEIKERGKPRPRTAAEKKQGSGFDPSQLAPRKRTLTSPRRERGLQGGPRENGREGTETDSSRKHSSEGNATPSRSLPTLAETNQRESTTLKGDHAGSGTISLKRIKHLKRNPVDRPANVIAGDGELEAVAVHPEKKDEETLSSEHTPEKAKVAKRSALDQGDEVDGEIKSYKIPKKSALQGPLVEAVKVLQAPNQGTKSPTDDKMPVLEPEVTLNFETTSDRDDSRSPPVITNQEGTEVPKSLEEDVSKEEVFAAETKIDQEPEITLADVVTELAYHEKATIRHRRYCTLCERWFPSVARHRRHLNGYQHRHTELTQRRTVHALFMLFTGKPCPRLLPVNTARVDCLPGEPTPLQVALQDVATGLHEACNNMKKRSEKKK
ncbi:uncharacterized protein LOC105698784 [Orussus abietinus]|uniref:uncharacterized protein LOC105698784 n=1 Tax=Orussus abietinus TaxID=222816 RepID=UPI0006258D10|nr:uncharacterized protein LOC105698784 [Orussus abietinus]XP_012278750.1 uncharacterized protein LOC105698784 [Orussus abietinus]